MSHLRLSVVALALSLALVPVTAAQETDSTAAESPEGAEQDKKSVWKRMFGGAERSTAQAETQAESGAAAPTGYSSELRKMQARLRQTQAAGDPEVRAYMDRVDAGTAGPVDLGNFANLLAGRGFLEIAEVYYREALRFDPLNTLYWTNLGTIQRQADRTDAAIGSYRKALSIDPGLAIAHYNLGAAYDAKGKYDLAIDSYVRAFTIDASLSDPRTNPQVVNNTNLAAASLILYQRQAGNQALPLIAIPSPDTPRE